MIDMMMSLMCNEITSLEYKEKSSEIVRLGELK